MDDLRREIDDIDRDIVSLLAKRFRAVSRLHEKKKMLGEEVFQPDREIVLMEVRKECAADRGLSTAFIEELFSLILEESRRLQKNNFDAS